MHMILGWVMIANGNCCQVKQYDATMKFSRDYLFLYFVSVLVKRLDDY